ncbi:MAG: N-acetylmuramoyl-L-alanine amidase [Actinomycetota bacterium]
MPLKPLFVIAVALAFPAAAAAGPAAAVRDVPLTNRGVADARTTFELVGLRWRGSGAVSFRTRSIAGSWSSWRRADAEDDRPDTGTDEGRATRAWRLGNPWWVGPSDRIEYRLRGDVRGLRASFVSSRSAAVPLRKLSLAGSPALVPRSGWGANEEITRPASFASAVRFAVIHHTAGTNAYTRSESAAIVRAIQLFHIRTNGWDDVGYNFLVDRFGQVFEGRAGGIERPVIGAHAEGFNTGSVGIAVIGTYGDENISAAARTAIERLIAWRLDVAHVDPLTSLSWLSGGNPRFATGTAVRLRAVSGHRDTGFTSCPGAALYRQLPAIALAGAGIGLPKLYDPVVTGTPGGLVRFMARLSSARPWTVRVTDPVGTPVASGAGTGPNVDWTWDATFATPTGYTYAIEAGADVRPAIGTVGKVATVLTMTGAQAKPATFTPNGDSQADSTLVSYTLSIASTVTATLLDASGATLATLFVEQKKAGRQSFRFTATGVADGRYSVVLNAKAPSGREANAVVPIVVDRTLAAFSVSPAVYSPNGDRRLDELGFSFVLAAPAHIKLVAGKELVYEGELGAGVQELRWDGRLRDGRYAAVLEATGLFGTRAQTVRFAADTREPAFRLLSKAQHRFTVNEQVTVTGTVGGVRVRAVVGPGRFSLSGGRGLIAVTAWDAAGNRTTIRQR